MTDTSSSREIAALLEIMARLRDSQTGCPWDVAQTFATVAPYTIEEAYEVAGVIEAGDWAALKDELGDLLLQAVFHARMAEEQKLFDFGDVVAAITDKMIRRHPHVFAEETGVETAEQQSRAWDAHKRREQANRPGGLLDDIPAALPALMRAVKLQKRAASVGFDWNSAALVVEKIAEEAREIAEAGDDPARRQEEFGDLLFGLANLARHLDVDPEAALRGANAKFIRRFRLIEAGLAEQGRLPREASLAEMEALWQRAKAEE